MTADSAASVEETLQFRPKFDASGLLTCVTIDHKSRDVLMVAHMNADALAQTLQTGYATYWSRSRGTLWVKGETSGARQRVRDLRIDCDQDALICAVEINQPERTCHTGRQSCFYRLVTLADGQIVLTHTKSH